MPSNILINILERVKNSNSRIVIPEMNDSRVKEACEKLKEFGIIPVFPDKKLQETDKFLEYITQLKFTDNWTREMMKDYLEDPLHSGAVMVALGTHKAGLFSNNDRLAKKLFDSGKNTSENVWRLPLGEEYDNDINSRRADFLNTGNTRWGGSITAAQFIKRFVTNNNPWAHIDIAGVTWTMKGGKNSISKLHSPGATAFGLRLIDNFLNGK